MADPQPMQVFDIGEALRDQVPLGVINKELAERKNFDYDAAFRDLIEFRKNELIRGGLTEQNILDEDLALFADEILLEKLSDGAYAREAEPRSRALMQATLVDAPTGAGIIKGAVTGFKKTPGPIPVKLVGAGLGAAGFGTAAYTPGEIFLRGDPTGLTGYEGIYPSEPLPSQRAGIEATRTGAGTFLSLITAGALVKQGVVDLGSDYIARNIENMAPGLKRSFSRLGQKIVRGTERLAESIARPFASPTTKAETAGAITKAGLLSAAPAGGAYLAETADPYNPLTRVAAEVGVSAIPTQRIITFVGDKTAGTLLRTLRNIFSKAGREDSASRQLVASLEALDAKYADVEFDRETFLADFQRILENSPLEDLVARVNAQLPQGRQQLIVPPLTLAQRTAGARKQVATAEGTTKEINPLIGLEALDRGLRKTNQGTGSYGELSNQLYEDFKLFSVRLLDELLVQAQGDPRALAEAAQIQEAVFATAILHRLESAKEAAITQSEKVQTPMRRKTQSELMITYVNEALDDVTEATDMLYDRAKERLAGQDIQPTFTLEAIRELQDDGVTSLPPVVSEILKEISPDASNLEANLNRLRGLEDDAFRTLEGLRREARSYLNTLPPRVEDGLQPLLTRIEGLPPQEQITILRDELGQVTRPSATQTRDVKGEAAYIRKLISAATAQGEFDAISARVADARARLTGQEATSLSLANFLDYRRRLSRANRSNVNQNRAAESYHMSMVEDGIIRDLEALSGGSSLLDGGPEGYQSFEALLQSLEEQGLEGVQAGLILLRKANAFNVAKHDVFTRTYIGDLRQKDPKGRLRINPKLAFQKLFTGSADEVSIRFNEIEDAINWINTGGFDAVRGSLTEDEIARFSESAIARLGTYQAGKNDLLKIFLRSTLDRNPESPTFNTVDPKRAQTFIEKNEEALGQIFPDVFQDLKRAIDGRLDFDVLIAEQQRIEADLIEQKLLSRFRGVFDNPGKRIRDILGTPQDPRVNSPQNFQQLIDEIRSAVSGPLVDEGGDLAQTLAELGIKDAAELREKTNKALVYAILDSAYTYAGGRNPSRDLDFQKFRQYLFDPLDGRDGDSVAELLQKNGIITQAAFKDYKTLINQSADIAQVMRNYGPQSVERLQDKAALLANILIRGLGAVGGNVILNRLKGIIGNVPGASMSVAQTTSNATAELGLNMPAGKVRDIYIRAMTEPDLMTALLAKPPRTEKKAIEYFRSLPAIFYSSGVRSGIEQVERTETGEALVPAASQPAPQAAPQAAPEPAPQPAPQAAPEPAPQPAPQAEPNLVSELAAAQMEAMRPTAQPAPDPVMARVAQRPTNLSSPESRGIPLDTRRDFERMEGQLAGTGRVPAQQLGALTIDQQLDAPLSVRNNNPGNLRMAGQPGAEKGIEGFASFSTPGQGLNALTRQIVLDTQTRGLTLGEFIAKYAPPSENDTEGYIRFMEQRTGVPRNRKVPEFLVRDIARAIVEFEGGKLALRYFFGDEMRAEREEATPPPVAQAPTPPPTSPPMAARATPQSIQRAARVLGPQDDIGMLASEMMMRDRPA